MNSAFKQAAALAAGFLMFCAIAQAQQGVCVYKDGNYEGPRRCFEDSVRNFDNLGINDQISSFQIHGNVDIIFYEHQGYSGANKRFSSSQSLLTGSMNDNFSSMKIVVSNLQQQWGDRGEWGYYSDVDPDNDWQNSDENDEYYNDNNNSDYGDEDETGRVCLYEDANYKGRAYCFENDDPRFENFGFDNKADSIRIEGNMEVELFQHADYKGFSRIYRRSVPRFKPKGRNQFSAIKIRRRGDGNNSLRTAKACLFPDRNYGGKPLCFNSDNPRFANFGFDNKADSILVRGNVEVILYQHENYTGFSRVFRNNSPRFRDREHDQFSSIRIRQRQ